MKALSVLGLKVQGFWVEGFVCRKFLNFWFRLQVYEECVGNKSELNGAWGEPVENLQRLHLGTSFLNDIPAGLSQNDGIPCHQHT